MPHAGHTPPEDEPPPLSTRGLLPSIRDLLPLEQGGTAARRGFDYQDHVAASFCIDALLDERVCEVWCETLDDITVLRRIDGCESAEFVQVKSDDLQHLWSPARLCAREKRGKKRVPGSSILEKSLAHDRCRETCTFRLVTTAAVREPLARLRMPRDHDRRRTDDAEFQHLEQDVGRRVGGFLSPAKNDHRFWLARCEWDVRSSVEDVTNRNLLALERALELQGLFLCADQRAELYQRLLQKARAAATADWTSDAAAKRIARGSLQAWLAQATKDARHPGPRRLEKKLVDAGLDRGRIELAVEQRRAYLQTSLDHGFLAFPNSLRVVDEVQAVLVRERARLDTSATTIDGPTFHGQCVAALDQLHKAHATSGPEPPVGLSSVLGCMYDVTNRCLHRFCEPAV